MIIYDNDNWQRSPRGTWSRWWSASPWAEPPPRRRRHPRANLRKVVFELFFTKVRYFMITNKDEQCKWWVFNVASRQIWWEKCSSVTVAILNSLQDIAFYDDGGGDGGGGDGNNGAHSGWLMKTIRILCHQTLLQNSNGMFHRGRCLSPFLASVWRKTTQLLPEKCPFDSSKENKMSIPQNKYVFKGGGGVCFRLRTNFAKVVPPPPF